MWIIIVALAVTISFFVGLAFLMNMAINDSYDMGGWDYDDDTRKDE